MLYLLPGLGADKRMYQGPWEKLDGLVALDFPAYKGEKTLAEMATRIIEENNINSEDEIGGSSLGSMLALEIFKQLNNPGVFLLGSTPSLDTVGLIGKCVAPFLLMTPISFLKFFSKIRKNLLFEMFRSAETSFMNGMIKALGKWEGYTGDMTKVTQIHGTKDRILKCPKDCLKITGGGHLIAMTHAEECIAFIQNKRK